MLKNRSILKELQVGMLVAVPGKGVIPTIGEAVAIPPNPTMDSHFTLTLWTMEKKAVHKPRWLRTYSKSSQQTALLITDVLLYDFTLTNKGMLRKTTRDYLMKRSA